MGLLGHVGEVEVGGECTNQVDRCIDIESADQLFQLSTICRSRVVTGLGQGTYPLDQLEELGTMLAN